ncbi:2Fe-2S iron-sulfur cluster-binding protein [Methanobrevibacter sp.]|uniref:2Fe-2S iron-sulfur cluster-binding protein n=1 Tax=Methanobrevibacter sp. TaxID=66852 RepID=UPI0038638642
MKVKIKIDDNYQIFDYEGDLNISVITLLEKLDWPIEYSCSCLQGICGACAMVINSEPKLACKTFLNEERMVIEDNQITIEPLSKFPLIKDLKVDRSILFDAMTECELWLENDSEYNPKDLDFEYEMSLCLMCGCCTEVCPNYKLGDFVGAPAAVSASKLVNQESDEEHLKNMKKNIKKGFFHIVLNQFPVKMSVPWKSQPKEQFQK